MFDRETWRFINTFAPWLSAIGTLTAVIVTLWLARRANRPNIKVSTAIVHLIGQGATVAQSPSFVQIRAVNHGPRDVKIKSAMWKLVGPQVQRCVVLSPYGQYSSACPITLEPGEEATFLHPIDEFPAKAESCSRS